MFAIGQRLTPQQASGLAGQFGDINMNRCFGNADGFREIALVAKEPHQARNIGGCWHTDPNLDRSPALVWILFALEVPPTLVAF